MRLKSVLTVLTLDLLIACGPPSTSDSRRPSTPPSPARDAGMGDASSAQDAGATPVADAGGDEACPGDTIGSWPAQAAELTDGVVSRIDCDNDVDLFYYDATEAVRLDVVVTDPRLYLHVLRASDGVGVSRGQRPGQILVQIPAPERVYFRIAQGTVPVGTTYSVQLSVESADIVCPGDRISETLTGASPMRRMDPVDADADNQSIFVSAESTLDCDEDVDTFVFQAGPAGRHLLRMQRRDDEGLNCRFLNASGNVLHAQEGVGHCDFEQSMAAGERTFLEVSNAAGARPGRYDLAVVQLMDMATCGDNDLQFGERCEDSTRQLPCNRLCRPVLSRCGDERAPGQTQDRIGLGTERHGFDCSFDTDHFQLVHGGAGTYTVTVRSEEPIHCSSWWSTTNNVHIMSRRMTSRQCDLSVRIREGVRGAFKFAVGAQNPFSLGTYTVDIERSD